MGVEYSPQYIAECWACDDGFMTGRRRSRGDVTLTCRRCENAFPSPLDGDVRIEVIGMAYGAEIDFERMSSLDEIVNMAATADGLVVLELGEARPLYYNLHGGDPCPVRGCGGQLRQTGNRSKANASTQASCDTCNFETFEKDVS